MWIVAKVKNNEFKFFEKDLVKKLGSSIEFYYPKIEYNKCFKT